jgi:DNA polymerase
MGEDGAGGPGGEALATFLRMAGITARLSDAPQDRFAAAEVALAAPAVARTERRPVPEPLAPPPAGLALLPDAADDAAAAVEDARAAARAATSLDALRTALAAFEGCALKGTAISTCFGEGPVGAPVMIVGEAPGRDEDEAGRPFVGRSGQLLEKMLRAIGFARSDVYITNVIPWRPPGNRTPSPIETATCEVFVRREIALVRPAVLVPVGGSAAKTLLRTDAGITSQRGRWVAYALDDAEPADTIDAMATYHPAYLLRTPAEKRRAWADLLAIRARLETVHGLAPL